jgi:hypothetical protein
MTALRKKWLGEFQKVVPAKIAARAMQIDRRLSNAARWRSWHSFRWCSEAVNLPPL